MPYIKRLKIKGFKSFARKTTIDFDRHTNVVVGPNGSGKSNIIDALCFVLGRLSIKSLRAAKASHLIFSGNKEFKSSKEAWVEISLNNSDKSFSLDCEEIIIKRIVKKSGQSIYKINNQTKTRQEIIELLNQAGIDPHGFNIVLQGEIEKFVKMPSENRRKIIEEIAGISIYEMRKEKSLKELEKTDDKLKQINAVLRERSHYLRNLEQEREQALRFQKLKNLVKRCKFSIIYNQLKEQNQKVEGLVKKIQLKKQSIEKKQVQINLIQNESIILNNQIKKISLEVRKASGLEQDSLISEISILKQEIAGLTARKENFKNQLLEISRRKQALKKNIIDSEKEINEMSKQKTKTKKNELKNKKEELENLEELKREYYITKSNFSLINMQIKDKKDQIQELKIDSNLILNQVKNIEKEIKIKENLEKQEGKIFELKNFIEKSNNKILELNNSLISLGKNLAIQQKIVEESEKIKIQVSKLDICPLCKTKITKEHIKKVIDNSNEKILKSKKLIGSLIKNKGEIEKNLKELKEDLLKKELEVNQRKTNIINLNLIKEKKQNLKKNQEKIIIFESKLKILESKFQKIQQKIFNTKLSEENAEKLRLEINELERNEERNLSIEIITKQRELERTKAALKQNKRDNEEIDEELIEIVEELKEKVEIAKEKELQSENLRKKYQKMFDEKNSMQDKLRIFETNLMNLQTEKRIIENELNELLIIKAQIKARAQVFSQDLEKYKEENKSIMIEPLKLPIDKLKEKITKMEQILFKIGNVNLRSLEVYEDIKEQYNQIKEKLEELNKEKEQIMQIILKIDKKKKKTFLQTIEELNKLLARNFSQLSVKGLVYLEPQDKKEIFNKGIDINIKFGAGKNFDVTSLSGGEQSLVALSLIFAIQELKPYCFYIFDEIDAALDKRNSEKLSYLLKRYMKKGQYIIITHNDSLISESSDIIYGVSMQEGISKVLSLKL